LSAFAQSGRIVELAWTPAATGPPPTHFIIEAGTVTGDRDFISVPVGLLTAVSGGPLPIGGYWVRVRGANASGIGPASREAYFSFPPLPVLDDFRAFWWEATHVTLQ
jgi:hypothetical protein